MGFLRRSAFWTAEALRGRPTARLVRMLAAAERLPPAELERLQAERLAALCARAGREVPHYAEAFRAAGVDPAAVRRPADIQALPFLDKDGVRAAGERLRHPAAGELRRTETGGSTGDPLVIWETAERQAVAVAARIRSRAWWGIGVGDLEVALFGGPPRPGAATLLRRAKDELIGSITIPTLGLSGDRLDAALERVRRLRPRHLFGYTSALVTFARHVRQRSGRADGGADLGVEVLFTTSEMLLPQDRALMEETFAARVADGYGSKEAGFLAHECPSGAMHARADTHVIEVVRDGRVLGPGEEGEIVATHLLDTAWPFLRYRTGDTGLLTGEPCACGMTLPVMRLTSGRVTDQLVRADGAQVHWVVPMYLIRETPGVVRYQVRQRTRSDVEVLLVVDAAYPADGDANIVRGLAEVLGGARVTVRHVDAIEQTSGGKYRAVVSELA